MTSPYKTSMPGASPGKGIPLKWQIKRKEKRKNEKEIKQASVVLINNSSRFDGKSQG